MVFLLSVLRAVPGYVHFPYLTSGYDKWAVYDGATNFLAHISKIDRSVEYNGEADEYKKSFVKYALKKLDELEKK